MEIAAKLKIDRTFVAMNKDEGWKISEFIPNAKQLDYDNWDDVAQAMDLLRRLHQSGEKRNIPLTNLKESMILEKIEG